MKKNSGITLISLAITIIIMSILAGVSIYYATPIIKKAQLQNINTNMTLIQTKAKTIGENAKFNNDTSKYIGQKISNITSNEQINQLINKGIIDVKDNAYLLSKTDLEKMGLNNIKYELGYIVNYDTDEVIYVKGFTYGGITCYRLSETKTMKIK